jgi:CRISPR-associated protein Csm3
MNEEIRYRKFLGKIEIKGEMECLSGIHIGASKESLEIGALDSPVVRDPCTQQPYIPGSSLKGKMRALLEKACLKLLPNRDGGSGISRHECGDWEPGSNTNKNFQNMNMEYPGALNCPVCRLFGSTGPGEKNRNYPARVKVRDLHLTESSRQELEQIDTGLYMTEWKFENGIDRITSAANPRNIERVPKGAKFDFSIIYDVEDPDTLKEDLENLRLALRLLEDDALGGHGSRGYGRVSFQFEKVEARKLEYYRGLGDGILAMKNLDAQAVQDLTNFFQS